MACHDPLEGRRIACPARGDAEGQGPCMAVAYEVDLRTQAAAGTSERVVFGLVPKRRPYFLTPAACW